MGQRITDLPDRGADLPLVSVVLVNFRGADDTLACLRHFDDLDWPRDRLQLIVVDNDSGDGSDEVIRVGCPGAEVYQSGSNLGFAGGCNFGVARARGDYVGFINNDARPHPQWVRAAVRVMTEDAGVGCVASKVLDWEGRSVDYVDGSLTWYGMGYKREAEWPDNGSYETPKNVLFGTGAAMFVPTELFREVGGFDERYFMFYEDVDLGWRLTILGYDVRYAPDSIAYHRHHVTMKKFGNFRETYLLERNAILSMYKNLGDELLASSFGAALTLAVRRSLTRAPIQDGNPGEDLRTVPKMALTGPYAIDYFLEQLPNLKESRAELQRLRTRTDREILPLFREAIEPAYPIPAYLETHEALVDIFDLAARFHEPSKVLVVTGEPLSDKMAGPAIRAWEMASALSGRHQVHLASMFGVSASSEAFTVVSVAGQDALRRETEWADIIIFQGFLLEAAPWLIESDKLIVADIYDPMHLEQLEQARDRGEAKRHEAVSDVTDLLNRQIARADVLLCASEKQRQFWLGQLASQGRINMGTSGPGRSLEDLLRVVPFGLEDSAPVQRGHGIRGTIKGVEATDRIILWGGGVYNWFDPLTLIRAVGRLADRHDDVRLVFMGMKHPNPGVPDQRIAWEARELSDRLGLTDRVVFFNSGWVPYRDRANFLLDADVGVSTHFEHVETAYSFRTRILDYLWAGLPIVATTGDSFGNILTSEGLGFGVPPEDVAALERALEETLYTPGVADAMREQVRAYAEGFRWATVLQPLLEFCDNPRAAGDIQLRHHPDRNLVIHRSRLPLSVRRDLGLVVEYFQSGGVRLVYKRAMNRLQRLRYESI